MGAVRLEDQPQRVVHGHCRLPVQISAGVGDLRHPLLHVLVALTVVVHRRGLDQRNLRRVVAVFRVFRRQFQHPRRQLAHRQVVARIADVVNPAAGDTAFVGDDLDECGNAVVHIGERAPLRAAIDQLDRLAAHDLAQELGDDPGATFLRRVDRIEAGADPVERPKQGEIEPLFHAIGRNDTIHHLLGTGVDPARFVDRPVHQRRMFRIKFRVGAHAVDLGGRGKYEPLAVFDAGSHHGQVGLEVEFKHP